MKAMAIKGLAPLTVMMLAMASSGAHALSDYSEVGQFFPMEESDCEIQWDNGKTTADYGKLMDEFGDFLRKDLDTHQSVAISTTPYYYGDDGHAGLTYWNYWPDGKDFGDYSQKWTDSYGMNKSAPHPKGLDIVAKYEDIVSCHNHKLWSVGLVKKPKVQKVTGDAIMVVQACNVKEGEPDVDRIVAGAKALGDEMKRRGDNSGMWVKFLTWGSSKADSDFKMITRYDDFVQAGKAWDNTAPGTDAYKAMQQISNDAGFSCEVVDVRWSEPRHAKNK